ncbi:MAG: amidohydrolase family protein [Acidimicrobiia bacterium]|jgi:predicted TIM-barrel fold metal-dependent hydrolase
MSANDPNLDWLVSVDDHVIEPANVWFDRLPAKHRDAGPRLLDDDAWYYEDKRLPTSGLSVTVGKRKEEFTPNPVPYSEMRPAAYDPIQRVADMDRAGILGSLCFPSLPRFCGQLFWEAEDKDLALLCIEAYNDWMIEDWCGAAPGRFIPLIIIPLWDPVLAAKEMERTAAKGATSFAFSENPEPLGLPTIHDPNRYWDPVLAAAQDLQMVVSMHVGSSSTMPVISSDAPGLANLTFGGIRAAGTMLAWIFSDCFERMPGLKIALSEGNIGWMPYFIERAEQVIDKQRHWAKTTSTSFYNNDVQTEQVMANLDTLNVRETIRNHIFGCFIEESSGLRSLDIIGEDNVMVETDYPHSDTTWPDCIGVARKLLDDAGLAPETQYKILRGNAEKLYRFTPAEPPAPGA